MTKIITRYFDSVEKARRVRSELVQMQRFSPRIMDLYENADGLAATLTSVHVDAETARAYQDRMSKGGAVLLVRAGYRPLGVAKITREVSAEMGAADMGGLIEEILIPDRPEPYANSLLLDHPHLLTRERVPGSTTYHMANWPIPLISRRKPMTESVIEPHAYMANWPIDHLVPHKVRYGRFPFGLLAPHNVRYGRFPFGLLAPHHVRYGRFPFGLLVPGNKYMANFPFGHIIPGHKFQAKFPFGHLVPRGMRMANWPFPLLINGKPGTNAIIPKGPRMANFPIPLLSARKPADKFAFPRHSRMANFLLPLISRREPFTGSIFPRHARMADFILPLVTRSSVRQPDSDKSFSFSRMLGLPTLKER